MGSSLAFRGRVSISPGAFIFFVVVVVLGCCPAVERGAGRGFLATTG